MIKWKDPCSKQEILHLALDWTSIGKQTFASINQIAGISVLRGVVFHVAVIIGAFGMASMGAPTVAISVLVVGKTFFDLLRSKDGPPPERPPAWLTKVGAKVGMDVEAEYQRQLEQIENDELPMPPDQ